MLSPPHERCLEAAFHCRRLSSSRYPARSFQAPALVPPGALPRPDPARWQSAPYRPADSFLRAVDNPIGEGNPGWDLDIIAEITAKLNFAQHDLVFLVNLGHQHSMRAEDQGRGGNAQDIGIRGNVKVNHGKSTRP